MEEKRLIDADALLLELEEELSHKSLLFTTEQNELIDIGLRIAAGDIRHQPTVDAVPVVRCRDCKYWKPSGSKAGNSVSDMEYIGGCKFANYCRRERDFCSYGERKDCDGNG